MKSTYLMKPTEVQKKWYIIDAQDKPLGRVAATVATIFRGKHRPTYTSIYVWSVCWTVFTS